ncbi:MAG: hypothetical protein JWL76_2088 [Thermoleophilia bacterium]|nr:hypothetical protein [Thermoleophilia bacterium]
MGIDSWQRAIETARTFAGAVPVATDTTVDDALDALVVFARDDARAGSLEPVNEAAASLLATPSGERARRTLDGITSWVDARPHGALSSVVISGGAGGDQAIQGLYMLQHLEDGVTPTQWSVMTNFLAGPLSERIGQTDLAYLREDGGTLMAMHGARDFTDLLTNDFTSLLPRLQRLDAHTGTHVQRAWDNASALLEDPTGTLARERRWDQLYELLHELEHATAGTDATSMVALRGVEEGTADLHARWPGAVEELAAHLRIADEVTRPEFHAAGYGGLLREPTDVAHPYDGWRDGMRGYVELAGIDPSDPSQLAASRDLLRGVDLADVPARLARRIAQRQGYDDQRVADAMASIIRVAEPDRGALALRS